MRNSGKALKVILVDSLAVLCFYLRLLQQAQEISALSLKFLLPCPARLHLFISIFAVFLFLNTLKAPREF